jgi:KDO2-lipid IV(A) lauroyltransferase
VSNRLPSVLSIRSAYRLGEFLAALFYRLSGDERRVVAENLGTVLGGGCGPAELERRAREVYLHFSRYLVDVLYHGRRLAPDFMARTEWENARAIDQARARGRGVIFLSAHLGNWELAAMMLASRVPMHVVVEPHHDPRIDRWFMERRRVWGVRVFPTGRAVRRCLVALGRNECIGLNADRPYGERGSPVSFFGRPARLPRGPAFLSLRSGAPIVGCYFMPRGPGDYLMRLYDPIDPEGLALEEIQRRIARLLEDMIRRAPTQWFAFEPLWNGA